MRSQAASAACAFVVGGQALAQGFDQVDGSVLGLGHRPDRCDGVEDALDRRRLERHDPDVGVTALGTDRGLETRLVPERGYDLRLITATPMPCSLPAVRTRRASGSSARPR